MNGAHLHLIVNHVSIFAILFGTLALGVSMKRKSVDLRLFAMALFLIAAAFGWIAEETGEKAEDIVKALGAGTKPYIHEHELAATWALRSGALVGVLSIGAEWAIRKKKKWAKAMQWALLVFAIHGCTVFARTAYLGGQIGHSEIRN